MVNGKKYEVVGVTTTYISREIRFHSSANNYPNKVWKKLKKLFNKGNERQIMQLEKEMISLEPLSFNRIEYYFLVQKSCD